MSAADAARAAKTAASAMPRQAHATRTASRRKAAGTVYYAESLVKAGALRPLDDIANGKPRPEGQEEARALSVEGRPTKA